MNNQEKQSEIAALEKKLARFFKHNPYSRIQQIGDNLYIVNPWNDSSIVFLLKDVWAAGLISALNKLVLPPRFTAIYHLDSNTLKCIYTLLEKDEPYFDRQFDFVLDGRSYACRFAAASQRLLTISKSFRRSGKYSEYEYRNLIELREYIDFGRAKKPSSRDAFMGLEPISFYIGDFTRYDEEKFIDVSKHVNFFMQYYDRGSPYILIHPAKTEKHEVVKQLEIIEPTFPKTISTRHKDPLLLDLANSARLATTRLQFIYYYQILEYSAFYHIEEDARRQIVRIISAPDIHSNPDMYVPRLLEVFNLGVRQEEDVKLQKVVKLACTPHLVWQEIQPNISYFSTSHEFDGGFVLEPLIDENMTLDSFCSMWHPKIADTLRVIRNALVHGREKKFGRVIIPTSRNDLLIQPWVSIVRRIAEEILVYEKLT